MKKSRTKENAMAKLTVLRKTIEGLDEQILRVLNQRGMVASRIGRVKKLAGLPLVDTKREAAVIKHAVERNKGPFCDKSIERIFRLIMRESVFIQKRKS
jgi:chorismate mutase